MYVLQHVFKIAVKKKKEWKGNALTGCRKWRTKTIHCLLSEELSLEVVLGA